MNIAYKFALSATAVSASVVSYIIGTRLGEQNSYQPINPLNTDDKSLYINHRKELSIVSNEHNLDSESTETLNIEETKKAEIQKKELIQPPEGFVSVSNSDHTSKKKIFSVLAVEGDKPQNDTTIVKVKSGDSFINLARGAGVTASELTTILYRSRLPHSLFNIKKGQEIKFEFMNHSLSKVFFFDDKITYIQLTKSDSGKYTLENRNLPSQIIEEVISFPIYSSLSVDGKKVGLSTSEITEISSTLKNKVNFSSLTPGVTIKSIFSREVINSKKLKSQLLAVQLISDKNTISAYYYKDKDSAGYYDEEGVSVLPSFLRHPIKKPIISSRFNLKRKHPILKVVRPHYGTDYAHWKGTPILSISDATVKFAGVKGGFGNTVILSHPNEIETLSAHMSRFAKGINSGVKVKKGQVIGYVGRTGLSTGYHLHFELRKKGRRVDSLTSELPTVDKVSNLDFFKNEINRYHKLITSN